MEERIEKERSEVPEPASVLMDGIRFEAVPWGKARGLEQNGGYVAAIDDKTGHELWLLKVYSVVYDGQREDDKQDLFIESLAVEREGLLCVKDERGGVYRVDVRARKVVPA